MYIRHECVCTNMCFEHIHVQYMYVHVHVCCAYSSTQYIIIITSKLNSGGAYRDCIKRHGDKT